MINTARSIWEGRDLVVFDLDGTLYSQGRLRAYMAFDLLMDAARSQSLGTIEVLRQFRACREALARGCPGDFLERQFTDTAACTRRSKEQVETIVGEWIDRRPLVYLARCRYPGIEELFSCLRHSGRTIAVLSDHPIGAKLAALSLKADVLVSATDDDVRSLKPDPAGLAKILDQTGTPPGRALMVGDRFDRDLAVAARMGVDALIRSRHRDRRCLTFRTYRDALFAPVRNPVQTLERSCEV